jgi:hypothetical protein
MGYGDVDMYAKLIGGAGLSSDAHVYGMVDIDELGERDGKTQGATTDASMEV